MAEKSKIELIQEFFEQCPLLQNGKIVADYLGNDINEYAIIKSSAPPIVTKYRGGGSIRQIAFDFVVQAPISTRNIDNLANSKFGEDLENWIEEQDDIRNLPKIANVQHIQCTSPSYILQRTNTQAIYLIQMNCIYYQA